MLIAFSDHHGDYKDVVAVAVATCSDASVFSAGFHVVVVVVGVFAVPVAFYIEVAIVVHYHCCCISLQSVLPMDVLDA